jgi:tetratricopeptide (TPR) repeat protein/predicted Ser/Thr protein kinase
MGTCPDENALSAFAERRLAGPARAAIEAHLDTCADCLAVVAQLVGTADGDADPEAGAPIPGARVGRYALLEMIGQGGMGTVYLAHDPQLERRVALKVLRADRSRGAEMGARLLREARTMARLAHPNIVTVYDAGEVDGRFHIAMELVEGGSLSAWLAASARSTAEILEVFGAAGRALSAAHAAGVVHRDFKPDNVLIDHHGRVVVTDFGIASSRDLGAVAAGPPGAGGPVATIVTRTGAILGTPRYMAPEQHAGEKADARADQWSFAVSLYEALYDALPFGGADLAALRRSIAERRFADPPGPPRRKVPPRVRAAILRALAGRPEDRFPTIDALIAALEEPRWVVRARLASVVAGVLVIVLGAASLVGRARRPGDAGTPVAAEAPHLAPDLGAKRPAVVLSSFANRTGDARLDGVVEAALATALSASRRLDAHSADQLGSLAGSLGAPASVEGRDAARELAARDGRLVVTVEGTVTREGGAITAAIVATRLDTGGVLLADRVAAASDAEIVPAVADLAARVRSALGDPPQGGEERPRLSASLEALHAWAEGRTLAIRGDEAGAVGALRRAVAADPGFAEAHAELGLFLFGAHDVPGCIQELQIALANPEGTSQRRRLRLLASLYRAEGRDGESIAAAEQLLSIWPGDLETQTSVAATAITAGYWPLALELSRRAVADHPRGMRPHANLLIALLGNNDVDEVVRIGDRDLAEGSRLPPYAIADVAMAHALRGERDLALGVYDKLAVTDPELADEGRADLAVYEGRLDDAARILNGQIDAARGRGDPESATTELASLARIQLRRGDRRGALASGHAALGSDFSVEYLVANVLLEAGDEAPAARLARAGADRPGTVSRLYAKLAEGDVLLHHGKLAEARAVYESAGRLLDVWWVHGRLGEAALRDRRWADAERELAAVVARRGEVAIASTPSLQLLPPVIEGLAQARAALAAAPPPRK